LSEGILANLRESKPDVEKWLSLKFCDNSCGSGHFLRQMIEGISYEVFTSRSRKEKPEKESLNSFRRQLNHLNELLKDTRAKISQAVV